MILIMEVLIEYDKCGYFGNFVFRYRVYVCIFFLFFLFCIGY